MPDSRIGGRPGRPPRLDHPKSGAFPAHRRAIGPAILCIGLLAAGGCAADRPLHVRLDARVIRPERSVVVLFVDGMGRDVFHRALEAGDLPHIRAHLVERGVGVDRAVVAIPSITYANSVTFLTGLLPGHHGIMANRWFDPTIGLARDYCTAKTYQWADRDYTAPTIHHLLSGVDAVNLQSAQRRGASYTIDNWMTSGINWFFGNSDGVDCLVAQNWEEMTEHSNARRRWPAFVYAYFPGLDHAVHDHGKDSAQARRSMKNVDQQIGRICDALRQAGMYDRTWLILVSDHGHVDTSRERVLDIAAELRRRSGRRVERVSAVASRHAPLDRVDAICSWSGSRWTSVHFRRNNDWTDRFFTAGPDDPLLRPWLGGGGDSLLDHPAAGMVAGRASQHAAWIRTPRGTARVERESRKDGKYYRYVPEPNDAIGLLDDPELRGFVSAGWQSSHAWLERTADWTYPDLVPQIVEMFDSARAGDIVFFASAGWNFAPDEPGAAHGSVLAEEMLVPMIFAGPGLRAGESIRVARTCDLMPTVLDMLQAECKPSALDGRSLYPQLFPSPKLSLK